MTDPDDTFWHKYDDVLTVTQLGEILRLKSPSVLLRLKNGTIPAYWIGGSWIIFTTEIRAWLPSTLNRPAVPAAEESEPDGQDAARVPGPDLLASFEDVMKPEDLGRLFGKNEATIYRWLNTGVIPAYRDINNRWTIHKHQIRTVLQETSNLK